MQFDVDKNSELSRRKVLRSSGVAAGGAVFAKKSVVDSEGGEKIGKSQLVKVDVGLEDLQVDVGKYVRNTPLMSLYSIDDENDSIHLFTREKKAVKKYGKKSGIVVGNGLQTLPTSFYQGVEKSSVPIYKNGRLHPGKKVPINNGFIYPTIKLKYRSNSGVQASVLGPEVSGKDSKMLESDSQHEFQYDKKFEIPDVGMLEKSNKTDQSTSSGKEKAPTITVDGKIVVRVENKGRYDVVAQTPDN